jgi:hypothetical protein
MSKIQGWNNYSQELRDAFYAKHVKEAEAAARRLNDWDQRYLDMRSELILGGMDSDDADVEAVSRLEEEDEIAAQEQEDEDNECHSCKGTGIGRSGDPDTSRCSSCGGKGYVTDDADYEADIPEKEYFDEGNFSNPR